MELRVLRREKYYGYGDRIKGGMNLVKYTMREFIHCTRCKGNMILEDRGEVIDSVDVMTFFGYRCVSCGHVEAAKSWDELGTIQLSSQSQRNFEYTS